MPKTSKTLASAFTKVLKQWLTPEQLAEVRERNRAPSYKRIGACATHDFCDANMAMHEAFIWVFGREPDDMDDATINEAWSSAKAKGFK